MKRLLPFLIPAMSALVSCSNSECYDNHSALPLADFFSSQTMGNITVNELSVYGVGAPGDSILYYNESLQQAYLPFRLDSDTTKYVFKYMAFANPDLEIAEQWDDLPCDTLTFVYQRKPWFVSAGCGAMYFFDMKSVTHTDFLIDSIATNKTITNENAANIKIFFFTAQ